MPRKPDKTRYLNAMNRVVVLRYIPDPKLKDEARCFGSLEGTIELVLQAKEGPPERLLIEIGVKGDEGWYGKISNQPRGIFVLDEDFITQFRQPFKEILRR